MKHLESKGAKTIESSTIELYKQMNALDNISSDNERSGKLKLEPGPKTILTVKSNFKLIDQQPVEETYQPQKKI